MKSLSTFCYIMALVGASSLLVHGNTNTWGQVLYTRYQESKLYYAPTTSAIVLKTLVANETVKADFKEGKWYAIFKPSEAVRGIENVVGYMEEADLFPEPLPPGPIAGGVGDAPKLAISVETMKRITPTGNRNTSQNTTEKATPKIVQAQPSSVIPNALSVINELYAGEGIVDTGRYSRDQQLQIFNERFKDNKFLVHGQISDVGLSAFGKRKYITVMVTKAHYFDVFPSDDFDLLKYSKGKLVDFVGTWTSLGTGIIVNHKIEQAASPSDATRNQIVAKNPTAPSDQQAFAQQLRAHQQQYRDVQKLNNELRLKEVAENASTFMESARDISGWTCKAKGVISGVFGTVWVEADCDGIQYNLHPNDSSESAGNTILTSLKTINKGDWIQFTGRMTGSSRLTKAGAILDPAMRVVLTSVQTLR